MKNLIAFICLFFIVICIGSIGSR